MMRNGIACASRNDRPDGRNGGDPSAFKNQRERIGVLLQRPMLRFGGDGAERFMWG
jgi:hypothetical protein